MLVSAKKVLKKKQKWHAYPSHEKRVGDILFTRERGMRKREISLYGLSEEEGAGGEICPGDPPMWALRFHWWDGKGHRTGGVRGLNGEKRECDLNLRTRKKKLAVIEKFFLEGSQVR